MGFSPQHERLNSRILPHPHLTEGDPNLAIEDGSTRLTPLANSMGVLPTAPSEPSTASRVANQEPRKLSPSTRPEAPLPCQEALACAWGKPLLSLRQHQEQVGASATPDK